MTTQKSNGGKGEKRAFGLKHEAAEEKGQKESSETARRLVDGPSQSSELCRPSGYAVTFQSPYVRDCTASETAQGLVNIKFTWTMTNGHPDQTAFQTLFNPGNTGNGEWQDSTTGDKLGTVLIEAIKGMLFSAGTYGSTNSAAMKTAMGNNGVMFSPTSTTRFSVDTEFSESYPPGQYEATVTIQVFHDTATGQAEATSLEIGQRLVNYGGALLSKDVGCFRPRGNNADSNGLTAADCASQYTDALTTATYGSGPTDVERYIGQIFSPTYNQYLAVTLYDYETITLLCNGVQADAFTPVAADKLTNNLFDAMYGACSDSTSTTDEVGNYCSWYNDNDATCTIATTTMKEACPYTCSQCFTPYQTRLFAVFDSKRYVCTQDTGTSTWSWELKSDGFIEFAEAGFFRGIEEAKGNAWTMDQWMTVLSDSSNLALSTTNAQLGMLVSSDMTSSTAAQTYVTTGVTTLANTYATNGQYLTPEGTVVRFTSPYRIQNVQYVPVDEFESGRAFSFGGWVRNLAGQELFHLYKGDDSCLSFGPRQLGPYLTSGLSYQPFTLRYGMYKYKQLLEDNPQAYWGLFTDNLASGFSFYTDQRGEDATFEYPRNYPNQLVLEPAQTGNDDLTDWLSDDKWHFLLVVVGRTRIKFFVDGETKYASDHVPLLRPELCQSTYEGSFTNNVALVTSDLKELFASGLVNEAYDMGEATEQTQEEGLSTASGTSDSSGTSNGGSTFTGGGGTCEGFSCSGFGGRRALEEGDSGEGEWVVDGSHQESGKKEKRKRKLDDNQYSIVMGQVLENNFVNGNPKAEVYDFQFWSRGLSQGEAQELYYQGIKAGIGGLVGAKEDPLASRETSVKLYERETVSVMPPLISQKRSPRTPCDLDYNFTSTLQTKVAESFQIKCTSSYNCTFPDLLQLNESMREFVPADTANKTNFACVNREAEELIQHWDRSPNELQGNKLFTEITHMFDYAVVFRDNKIQSTTEWVDLKTNEVTLWQLFYTPGKQIGTKLEITFELSEEGVSHKTTDITSIQRNPGDRYAMLMVFGAFCIFFAVLHLIYGILSYLCGLEKDPTRPGRLRQSTLFADPLPLVIFDTILRSCIAGIMLLILVLEYEKQEKVFNETLKAVVEVPWTSEQVAFSDKFTQFFTALGAMLQVYYVKNILDMLVVSVIFLCLVRICMYLSVHPRIAILVDTVKTSLDDLFHFFITFAGLYLLFAFMAFYSYGDVIKEFASFGQACYTQFRMVLGDWAFPVDRGDAFLYIYMVAFALVIFFILLNFFLAIIIDAYAEVKKHVEDSLVEKNLMVDMWDLAAYSMLASRQRLVKNTREEVLKQLARVKTDEIPWVSRYELRKMNSVFGKSKKRFFSWRRGAKSKSTHGVNSDEGLGTKNIYKRFSAVGFMTEDALGWIPSVNARADAFFDFYSNRHPSLQEPYGDLDKDEKKPKVQDEEESDDENGIEQWLGLGGRIMKQPEAISDDPKVMARDIRSLRETCCAQTEQLDQLSRFLLGDAYQSTNLNQLRGSIAMITKSKSKFMKKISSDQAGHPNAILTEEEAETQHEESSSYMHKDSFGVLTFGSMGSKTQKETTHATAPITITDADDKHKGSKDKAAEELGALDELISSMGGDPPKEGEELSQNTESLGRGSVGGEREEEPTQAAASSAHVQEQRPTSVHRVEAPSEESEAYIFPSLQQTGANVSLGTLGGRHSRAGSVNSARSSVPETAGLLATRNTRESLKQGGGRGGAGRGLSGGSAAARAGKAIVGGRYSAPSPGQSPGASPRRQQEREPKDWGGTHRREGVDEDE